MALQPHRWSRRYVVAVPLAVALIAVVGSVLPAFLNRHAQRDARAHKRVGAGYLQPPGLATLVAGQRPDANGKVYVRESPREIVKSIRNTLPVGRAEVFNSTYAGRWVRWRGTILRVTPGGPPADTFLVLVREPGDERSSVSLDFSSGQRPTVEQLREGDAIEYEAQIKPDLADGGGTIALHNVASVRVVDAPRR